jgi:hypothetical protein
MRFQNRISWKFRADEGSRFGVGDWRGKGRDNRAGCIDVSVSLTHCGRTRASSQAWYTSPSLSPSWQVVHNRRTFNGDNDCTRRCPRMEAALRAIRDSVP